MPRPNRFQTTPLGDTDRFIPCAAHPVRVRARSLPADTHFEHHRHDWAQLAYCATGTIQVVVLAHPTPAGAVTDADTDADAAAPSVTYIVPPSRAVWIAPGALHAINVLEALNSAPCTSTPAPYLSAGTTAACWWSAPCCAS